MNEEKIEIMNPLDIIGQILKRNDIDGMLTHINYDKSTNENHDIILTQSSSHDGTLIFTYGLFEDILIPLMNKTIVEKSKFPDEDFTGLKDVKYTIGDMVIKNEYGVTVKHFTGMKQTVSLPIKFEYIFE